MQSLHPTEGPLSLPPYPSLPTAPLPINDKPPLISPTQKETSKEISKGPQKTPGYLLCLLQPAGGGEFDPQTPKKKWLIFFLHYGLAPIFSL